MKPTRRTGRVKTEHARLRRTAHGALAVGAVGSVALLLRAGRSSSPALIAMMAAWVLAPLIALAAAQVVSARWPILASPRVHWLTIVVALGSLAAYGFDAVKPHTPRAFMFVAVPLACWLFVGTFAGLVVATTRKRR